MTDLVYLHAAFGRSTLDNLRLRDRVAELETLVDKLRMENAELKHACHAEIARVRAEKAETVALDAIDAEDLEPSNEPEHVRIVKKGNPPLRI